MEQIADLIFDIGFHKCEDVDYYLRMGYKVIGVDADYSNITDATQKYKEQINNGQLVVEHYAITEKEEESINFYKSEYSMWSSIHKEIVNRQAIPYTIEAVTGKPLSFFFKQHGIPFYCKIDIEGQDIIALKSIEEFSLQPQYISVESECIGKNDQLNEDDILKTLFQLKKLGYKKFKLIEQNTLKELYPGIKLFGTNLYNQQKRYFLRKTLQHTFPIGASGPFGPHLGSGWLNYNEAIDTILFHRSEYFKLKKTVNYGFWCDWHATF